MNPLDISTVLRSATLGSRNLMARLKEEATQETGFVIDMMNEGWLTITERDVARFAGVEIQGFWPDGDNRWVAIQLTDKFVNDFASAEILFLGRMSRALEAIESVE